MKSVSILGFKGSLKMPYEAGKISINKKNIKFGFETVSLLSLQMFDVLDPQLYAKHRSNETKTEFNSKYLMSRGSLSSTSSFQLGREFLFDNVTKIFFPSFSVVLSRLLPAVQSHKNIKFPSSIKHISRFIGEFNR